jgi:hypothetical protein
MNFNKQTAGSKNDLVFCSIGTIEFNQTKKLDNQEGFGLLVRWYN